MKLLTKHEVNIGLLLSKYELISANYIILCGIIFHQSQTGRSDFLFHWILS